MTQPVAGHTSRSPRFACCVMIGIAAALFAMSAASAEEPAVSDASQDCIFCHAATHPGIVADWKRSRHARTTPAEAMKKPAAQRRISVDKVPEKLESTVVGCAECHTVNHKAHKDVVDHNDYKMHVTVTPKDCATCHPVEAKQFEKNMMSFARTNLVDNKLFMTLVKSTNGLQHFKDMSTSLDDPDEATEAESCFHCHGTAVEVKGKETRETDQGEMEFAKLAGWPNPGVGRYNPDGSKGTCTACHSRHQFSIEMARKPHTCAQCHKGPDVPAYPAYNVSKHGNLYSSLRGQWDFNAVPWTVGKDFASPTCATCHISLVVNQDGETVTERTHEMADRLPFRVLGLIYGHAHPRSPNTSIIKNKEGLPLPTSLDGKEASDYLIDAKERATRQAALQKVCRACHSQNWVNGHWKRFENTMRTTNAMTLTATQIQLKAWDEKVSLMEPSLFDEALEKKWVQQWLFYANSTRFASAMMGADYGVFANGRWYLSKNVQEMLDRLKLLLNQKKASGR